MNGYEETYKTIVPRLQSCDFLHAARNLGFTLISNNRLSINFLGRIFEITRDGIKPVDGQPVNVNFLSVLVYYAVSKGGGEPTQEFYLLHHFTHGVFSGGTISSFGWMTRSLRKVYGGDYQKFSEAAKKLGMVYKGGRGSGTYVWNYQLLPKMPIQVVYIEADDEFPCDIQIYYDKTALQFLDFEPLAFLNGCFASALAALGR